MGAGATIAESMPKNWFFDIHEDTPEEEASNLMEHSTLTLDLSSDEESEKRLHDERGKENMPPEGYDAVSASRSVGEAAVAPARVRKDDIVRKKIVVEDMDDGERSPLASLETGPFIPGGMTETQLIVDATPEKRTEESKTVSTAPVPFTAGGRKHNKKSSLSSMVDGSVSEPERNSNGEIVIWEDSSVITTAPSTDYSSPLARNDKLCGDAVADENIQPPSSESVVR